jgi:hypothetical protein
MTGLNPEAVTPIDVGRPWEGPIIALGFQLAGQVPPEAPLIIEWIALSLATACIAPAPKPGGAIEVVPTL